MTQLEESMALLDADGPLSGPHPFDDLPVEVLELILGSLSPFDFVAFAFAVYPTLWIYGLVPTVAPISLSRLQRQVPADLNPPYSMNGPRTELITSTGSLHLLTSQTSALANLVADAPTARPRLAIPLPIELIIHILKLLSRKDQIHFVLADYRNLCNAGIVPVLTSRTLSLFEHCQDPTNCISLYHSDIDLD